MSELISIDTNSMAHHVANICRAQLYKIRLQALSEQASKLGYFFSETNNFEKLSKSTVICLGHAIALVEEAYTKPFKSEKENNEDSLYWTKNGSTYSLAIDLINALQMRGVFLRRQEPSSFLLDEKLKNEMARLGLLEDYSLTAQHASALALASFKAEYGIMSASETGQFN